MAIDSIDERTRRRLRELREQAGLSLAASTVSRLESGARRLTLDHLPPLARALGVTVDALLAPPEQRRADLFAALPLGASDIGPVSFEIVGDPTGEPEPR